MLPMGTIVTVCMLIGLLTLVAGLVNRSPKRVLYWLAYALGGLVFIAGAWNTFWHGIRHLNEFWGIAALLSGIVMMLAGFTTVRGDLAPSWIKRVKPVVVLGLLGFFLLYAITIYRL